MIFLLFAILFASCSSSNQVEDNLKTDENIQVDESSGDFRVINLDSFNFGYSQKEITVKKGEKVKIIMTSSSGTHNFVIDELSVQSAVINSGGKTEFEFVADKIGSFEYYCSIGSHRDRGMVGTIIITE